MDVETAAPWLIFILVAGGGSALGAVRVGYVGGRNAVFAFATLIPAALLVAIWFLRERILPEESTRRVVEKMEKYKTIERIQWEGALAIKLRVEAGGTKALKGARAALAGRPGAAAQESKAPSGSDGGAERKESITQAERVVFRYGALPLLLRAMRAHPASLRLQVGACKALNAMACSERVRTEVLKQGGIGRVVDALRVHRTTDDNDELLSVACKLIGTILDDLDLDAVLAEKGSAEASGAAEYSSSEESKARVRRMAKQRKTLGPEQITNDLRLAIDGIAEAMRRHKANPDVNRWALYALLIIASKPAKFDLAQRVAHGALDAICGALRASGDDPVVRRCGVMVIVALLQADSSLLTPVTEVGCMPVVEGLVKRYGTADPQVDLFGSKILAIQKQMASLAHSAAGLGVGEEGVRVLAAEAAQKGKARARKPSARATKAAAATAAASGSRGVEVVELDGAEEQKRD